ncbi:MAG: DHH family phosphoesterase [Patescibacteria group bacterium]
MALTETQQIFELVKKSRSILIVFKKDWTGDSLSSALALSKVLKKIDKKVEVVCQNFKPSANVSFLGATEINDKIENLQKFVISIDTSKTKVGEFYYDNESDKLNIYISPKNGQFKPVDVSAKIANYSYDLIFIVNSPDLESLGEVYDNHSEFFYSTPKINIDNSNKNEYFGDINLVDLTSSSTAEIIYGLIKNFDENLIDDDMATYLLCGIITSTKNFKTLNVSPKTLNSASLLITKGARREQIIQNLYQTRFLSTLKLWGRVLSRLNNDLNDKLVWSVISSQDFLETSTSSSEIIDVIDELIISMPKTEVIVLIYERREAGDIECVVYATKNIDSLLICRKFNPSGNAEISKFNLNGMTLAEAERIVIEEIKEKLK